MLNEEKNVTGELTEDELKEIVDSDVAAAGLKDIVTSLTTKAGFCPTSACTKACGK